MILHVEFNCAFVGYSSAMLWPFGRSSHRVRCQTENFTADESFTCNAASTRQLKSTCCQGINHIQHGWSPVVVLSNGQGAPAPLRRVVRHPDHPALTSCSLAMLFLYGLVSLRFPLKHCCCYRRLPVHGLAHVRASLCLLGPLCGLPVNACRHVRLFAPGP